MVLNLKKHIVIALAFFTFSVCSLFGLEVPALHGRVNDYANIINSNTEAEISSYLDSVENTTGIQIVVLTVPSLKGEDISSFSIKTAEQWGIGRKGNDDGALLVVALNEHQVRIEVGYGLEDKLTDAKCGLIIRNVMIPEFKNNNYSGGILKGVKNMGGIATNNTELISRSVSEEISSDSDFVGFIVLIFWIFVFIIAITSRSRRFYRHSGNPLLWMLLLGNHSSRGPHHSSHNSFGGSSFGGFGGSSGFHGSSGHFGGGGASGHW